MDATELIRTWAEFLEKTYYAQLLENLRKGERWLHVDFAELARFSPECADVLLDQPEECLKAAEIAVQQSEEQQGKPFSVRIHKLPASQTILVRHIRSQHLGKLIATEGIVRQKSEVRPQTTAARFECPSCGNVLNVLQFDTRFQEPSKCSCGRKGKFKLLQKELVDAQSLILEEVPEQLDGGEQPKRIKIFLKNDLVSPLTEKKTNPGSRVLLVGTLKEEPIILRTGGQSVRLDLLVEANSVETREEDFTDISITNEELQQILELSRDPHLLDRMVGSIAPSIYGHDKIKEALVLQLLGGVRKMRDDGVSTRGDMHVLLIGDPGAGKSQMLKRISHVSPKGRFISGKGVSGAGLTAAVVKDEFLSGWSLEAGALVLANRGICCLHPQTPVLIDNRVAPIETLFDAELAEMAQCNGEPVYLHPVKGEVATFNPKAKTTNTNKATMIRMKQHTGKVLTLKFASGFSITLTPDHWLLDGASLEWRPACEFAIGDYAVAPLKLPGHDLPTSIIDIVPQDWKVILARQEKDQVKAAIRAQGLTFAEVQSLLDMDRSVLSGGGQPTVRQFKTLLKMLGLDWTHQLTYARRTCHDRMNVDRITPELGYLLGFIAGDGHVSISRRRAHTTVTQSKKHTRLADRFVSAWHKVFDRQLPSYTVTRSANFKGRAVTSTVLEFHTGSPVLAHLCKAFTSTRLLELPDDALRAFLAGLFDSDGCISTKHATKQGHTYETQHIDVLASNDRTFNQTLLLALRRFDCYGRIRQLNNVSSIQLTGREDVHTFLNAIASWSVKAADAPRTALKLRMRSASDILPAMPVASIARQILSKVKPAVLQREGIWSAVYDYAHFKRAPSRHSVQRIISRAGQYLHIDARINSLLRRDFFLDRIVGVSENHYDGPVYDLYVPGMHNFTASGIIVHNCIDELDKMSEEDTAAMHEALEGQSYHPDTEILLSDGTRTKIGTFVDGLMQNGKVIQGTNCEFLFPKNASVLTTGFSTIMPAAITRVSRHAAPANFYRITFSNGRSVTVTPEHPLFVYNHGSISELPACLATPGLSVPAPMHLPIEARTSHLTIPDTKYHHSKPCTLPRTLTPELARLFGYIATEGHSHHGRNRSYEVGVSNTDCTIIADVEKLFSAVFNTNTTTSLRRANGCARATKDLRTVRCISHPIYDFLAVNAPELLAKSPQKRVPTCVMQSPDTAVQAFLQAAFLGDGMVLKDSFGYSTASVHFAEDYQDLLLRNGIPSLLRFEQREQKKYYKVLVSGALPEKEKFVRLIVSASDHRYEKIQNILRRAARKQNQRDPVPHEIMSAVRQAMLEMRMADGYFTGLLSKSQTTSKSMVRVYLQKIDKRIVSVTGLSPDRQKRRQANVHVNDLAASLHRSSAHVYSCEQSLHAEHERYVTILEHAVSTRIAQVQSILAPVRSFLNGEIRLLTITRVERLPNEGVPTVYDITVMPHQNFISQGVVLHNTITISKANIQATLRAETSVLAAANPKFGRFDPYSTVAEQINLVPTLINRFDLIFPIKDLPDPVKDTKMAKFVLELHKGETPQAPDVPTKLLRKYIAYAKQNFNPKLTDGAIEEIKEYYLKMRGSAQEAKVKAVPISARQLEGLVRMSEAAARMRLSDKVLRRDAKKAIELLDYCLRLVAFDEQTGTFDVDRIASDTSAAQRSKIGVVRELIAELEKITKQIAIGDLVNAAAEKELNSSDVEEIVEKLKRSGDLFETKSGFIQRL
ncbi:hypothetical protein HY642_04345 [Candidatus Woesearchaeota archaeon]|nr:hypothetical protein [Candidatus Woesearchaeota archaeon]